MTTAPLKDSLKNLTPEQQSFAMAIVIILDRIRRLPKEDSDDLFELIQHYRNAETEEEEIAAVPDDTGWRTKAVVPFGLPLIVGGGTLAYLITATNQFQSTSAAVAMSIVGLAFVALMWISLAFAVPLSHRLGDTGTQVIARFFGFVLLAIGWNIFTKGLIELMPGLAG